MSNPIDRYIGVNYTAGRAGVEVDTLYYHTIEGSLGSADNWFHNPTARASTHEGVGDKGEVYLWVRRPDTAWGAGATTRNRRSYQFENEGYAAKRDWTPAQLDALTERTVDALRAFPKIPRQWGAGPPGAGIKGHQDVDPTRRSDPGYVDLAYITWKAGKLGVAIAWELVLGEGDPPSMAAAFVQGLAGAGVDGKFGPVTAARVRAWQVKRGLTADGIFGPKSWASHYAEASKIFEPPAPPAPPAPTPPSPPAPAPGPDLEARVAALEAAAGNLLAQLDTAYQKIRELEAAKSGIGHQHPTTDITGGTTVAGRLV